MTISELSLRDFRSYTSLDVSFSEGLTVVFGDNGNGKTNLIEAVSVLSTLRSFRRAPKEALIRVGTDEAFLRANVLEGSRQVQIESSMSRTSPSRTLVNRQKLTRSAELRDVLSTTVFSPDDLEIVKGSPGERRAFLDELLMDLHPKNEVATSEFAKVLRQRNALLKQLGASPNSDAMFTLDVWDSRLVEVGERLAQLRSKLVAQLEPLVNESYQALAGRSATVSLRYAGDWQTAGLAGALENSRSDDIRRGVSTTGPHHDDVEISLDAMAARTHGSQGEQRSLVLSLRLAAHQLMVRSARAHPVLLLDDVFSELDRSRSRALLECLPAGQTIVTTAAEVPPGARPEVVLRIENSRVVR